MKFKYSNEKNSEDKPMNHGFFIVACIISWFSAAILIHTISAGMGLIYAEASFEAFIGFWGAKIILKNKHRNWIIAFSFPVIVFVSAFLGYVFESQPAIGLLVTVCTSLFLSAGLFSLLSNKTRITNS